MNIMSQDFKTLVNYDNVCSLYYRLDSDKQYRLYAMYAAVGDRGILTDILYTTDNKEKVESVFKKIIRADWNVKIIYISDYE